MVSALEQSGEASARAAIGKGLAWLERNQDPSGAWLSTSMNKKRDPASDAGRFMTDAATAYSVMALSAKPRNRAAGMPPGHTSKKVANSLVAMSSAAILAVYAAGYTRTRAAARRRRSPRRESRR